MLTGQTLQLVHTQYSIHKSQKWALGIWYNNYVGIHVACKCGMHKRIKRGILPFMSISMGLFLGKKEMLMFDTFWR